MESKAQVLEKFSKVQFDRDRFYTVKNTGDQESMNCETAVHFFFAYAYDAVLSEDVRAMELLSGHRDFLKVQDAMPLEEGDIFLFGSRKHHAVAKTYVPEYDASGTLLNYFRTHLAVLMDPRMLTFFHCNKQGVQIWSLSDFFARHSYEMVFGVRRYMHFSPKNL